MRQVYESSCSQFIVSPVNSRAELSSFISSARKELIIYDPKISDPRMVRLLEERAKAGVAIRIIGKFHGRSDLPARGLYNMRLHVRAIVRDGRQVFLGSQSLRTAELETRREVGIIFFDRLIANRIARTFEKDWAAAGEHLDGQTLPTAKAARRVAKAVAKSLPPMDTVLEVLVSGTPEGQSPVQLDMARLEEAMKVAVKQAVEQSVLTVVEESLAEESLAEEIAEVVPQP
jgi:phosphatidylserine/phosphatidylglycerophosphate/cardiolipin synthase-like enzyme